MQGIFLSYARSDDEPYTRSVYDRLRTEGYDVWFDREHMPSRSLTFLQEIRDAVRSRDRLVVVLGPGAVESDYVRAEWQAALVDSKVVTPVLRLGDYNLVPPELRNLHCPDVRAS
ncbi:MAG TPA: toll/interleukin-1 receptor domain-containing protein, partial [Gemmatimonadaceae bacterium]|nr:toll/interleukin-1 receptor domain-containing protein [Gemmatimonadaceae bacterium]